MLIILSVLLIVITAYSLQQRNLEQRIKAVDIKNNSDDLSTEVIPSQTIISPTIVPSIITKKIYLGMWTEGFWDDNKKELHTEKLNDLENKIGRKVAIAHYYRGWEFLADPKLITEFKSIDANGWRPMISANPYFFKDCLVENISIYKAIASGACDEFLNKAAVNLKNYGKPLFLRFAWEMNLKYVDWSLEKTYATASEFIAAWQRFYLVMKNNGVKNVDWVFSPNTEDAESIPYEKLYPGNEYVEWLGLDGYNKGSVETWTRWQSFDSIFFKSYNHLTSLAPDKPLMIAEVNTTNVGGNKPEWYQNALSPTTLDKYTALKAIVFYNENRTQENYNWNINISPESLSAFKTSISSSDFISTF